MIQSGHLPITDCHPPSSQSCFIWAGIDIYHADVWPDTLFNYWTWLSMTVQIHNDWLILFVPHFPLNIDKTFGPIFRYQIMTNNFYLKVSTLQMRNMYCKFDRVPSCGYLTGSLASILSKTCCCFLPALSHIHANHEKSLDSWCLDLS